MAYREINDSEVAANAPVTVALLSALRDNLTAVAGDDTGAPDVETSALTERPIGFNAAWEDVSLSRAAGVDYQNTTGQAIQVSIVGEWTSGTGSIQVSDDGSTWIVLSRPDAVDVQDAQFVVPNGGYYRVNVQSGVFDIDDWLELNPI